MFEGIVAERGMCDHCRKNRWVASVPPSIEDEPYGVAYPGGVLKLCSGCIYKLTRLAGLLLRMEAAPKKKAPKKAAKVRRRTAAEPPLGPFDQDEPTVDAAIRARMP